MSSFRFRSRWRVAAAAAALLAFGALTNAHPRGHEEIAVAWSAAQQAGDQVTAASLPTGSGNHRACPLCLSLARARNALVGDAVLELALLVSETPLAPPPPPALAEAPCTARSAPRAPPLV